MNGSWFSTTRGIIFTRSLAAAASTGSFAAYLGLHTLFLDNYRQFLQFYSSGLEKRLSPELYTLAGEVLRESSLTEKECNSIGFFVCCGFDPVYVGTTQTRSGCRVGLPNHFHYEQPDQVEKSTIKLLNDMPVRWSSPAGRDLLDSLVLSRAAKKFAAAREVHRCNTSYVYGLGLGASICITGSYLLGSGLARRFNLRRLPQGFRITLYSLCGALGLGLFLTVGDALNQYWDRYSDRAAALTSPEYLEGGIEFYRKCLKRNVALRGLLGETGEKYFTYHGNRKTWLMAGSLPLTSRLDYLQSLKKTEEKEEEKLE